MTLLAFIAHDDHAEMMTDTATWSTNFERVSTATKFATIEHLPAAIAVRGDGEFGDALRRLVVGMSVRVESFDELLDKVPEMCAHAWEYAHGDGYEGFVSEVVAAFVGYSHSRGRFVAYAYDSAKAFESTEPAGVTCFPMPWSYRPAQREVDELLWWSEPVADVHARARTETAAWMARPACPPPSTVEEWRELALAARRERSLDWFGRVPVGGRVFLTRLERDRVETRVIHEFDDNGEEFDRIVQRSRHPRAQLAPCHCGSGRRFVDCHLRNVLGEPCGCGVRKNVAFRDCCMVQSSTPRIS